MCGIAGMHRLNGSPAPSTRVLGAELMRGLEIRGRDATGFLTIEDSGNVTLRKQTVPATRFAKLMREPKWAPPEGEVRTMMVHTRFATVGSKDDVRNAHPHASGRVAIVHNGTIWNDHELFNTFDLPRRTTVDSEVIAAIVNEFGWDGALSALELLEGGAAVAMIHQDHPRDLILARVADYPLHWVVVDDVLLWASSPEVIRAAWKKATGQRLKRNIRALRDGQALVVSDGKIEHATFTPATPSWVMTAPRKGKRYHGYTGTVIESPYVGSQIDVATAYGRRVRERRNSEALERYAEQQLIEEIERMYENGELNDDEFEEELAIVGATAVFEHDPTELDWDSVEDDDPIDEEWDELERRYIERTGTRHGMPTTRGHVETKSPATQAWEALS